STGKRSSPAPGVRVPPALARGCSGGPDLACQRSARRKCGAARHGCRERRAAPHRPCPAKIRRLSVAVNASATSFHLRLILRLQLHLISNQTPRSPLRSSSALTTACCRTTANHPISPVRFLPPLVAMTGFLLGSYASGLLCYRRAGVAQRPGGGVDGSRTSSYLPLALPSPSPPSLPSLRPTQQRQYAITLPLALHMPQM
ncbi:unnamed protein product, partial [Urochloa humidicola]